METSSSEIAALLAAQVAIGQVAVCPAGQLAVYTRRTVVGERDRIDLWAVRYAGGPPRELTTGPSSDTTPRFSPDGNWIAYLSAPPECDAQVHVVAREGGPPRALAPFPHGASDLAWTLDGGALVVLAEDARPKDPTCHVVDRIDWRDDDEAAMPRRQRHLHAVPLDGGPPRRLTGGDFTVGRPRVAPDGAILCLADPRPDGDLDPAAQVHRVEEDGTLTAVTALAGGVIRFAVEDDGGLICIGHAEPRPPDSAPPAAFRIVPGGGATELAPGLDRWVGQAGTQTDLHDWCTELDDAGRVTGVAGAGAVIPCALTEAEATPLVDPELRPVAGAIAMGGGRVVAALTLGAGVSAPELYALERTGPRPLTEHGGAWLRSRPALPGVDVVEIEGPAGPIQTMLVHPPGAGEGPLATVLCVHGGPTGQWGVVPPLEAVLLAYAGYRVALPNIRGSYDRGSEWVRALEGRWGEADAPDCHAVLDHLVDEGLADPARLGVAGLSYGGFVTNWLVATSDRFAAAVSENGVTNQVSAWANCDCGPVYARAASLGEPTGEDGVASLWRQSPLRHVAAIRTPLLILQAGDDRRCPPADAEQLFVALRWLGRCETQYVLYPGEHHTFQGNGRFDRRVDRHRRAIDWFARHMPA